MKWVPILVGHPFAAIGRGEDIRSSFRCFQEAGFEAGLCNVSSPTQRLDLDLNRQFSRHLVHGLSSQVNLFYLNGDEITRYLGESEKLLPDGATNIVYPQWELGVYPAEWSEQLSRFDEIWAPSLFVYECLRRAIPKPVYHFPFSVCIELSSFLGRRYFSLPESAYLFLFCFDLRSYIHRKNPLAVLRAFEHVCAARRDKDVRLVIKLQGQDSSGRARMAFKQFMAKVESSNARDKVIMIDRVFTDNEIKNLIRCCDCFVSLHRSEGFGRGMAEAMLLGKPVVATGYSGNLDFMNEGNSCLVRYHLVDVERDGYPFWENQLWAEPDIDHAVVHMLKLVDDRDYGRALGAVASRHIRTRFSARAIGLRYQQRIDQVMGSKEQSLQISEDREDSPPERDRSLSTKEVCNRKRFFTHE